MRYEVRVAPAARRALKKLDRRRQAAMVARLEKLSEDPRPEDVKKLAGAADLYRIRVGEHRVIYRVEDQVLVVLVVRIGHRRDVYRRLGEL